MNKVLWRLATWKHQETKLGVECVENQNPIGYPIIDLMTSHSKLVFCLPMANYPTGTQKGG
jgi:hypothetical protein